MFFNNKKSEDKEEEISQEVKQEDCIISDYAMERYKKSEHYNKYNLINEEIELLFCDKKEWNSFQKNKINTSFLKVLKKLNGVFDYVVFYDFFQKNTDLNINSCRNCIFYNQTYIEKDDFFLEFIECIFITTDNGSVDDNIKINIKESLTFRDCESSTTIRVLDCSELTISNFNSNAHIVLESFTIDKAWIGHSTFNEPLLLKDINIKDFTLKSCKGHIHSHGSNTIEKCTLSNFESQFFILDNTTIKEFEMYGGKISNRITFDSSFKIINKCYIESAEINSLQIYNIPKITLLNTKLGTVKILGINESILTDYSSIDYLIFTHLENQNICVLKNNTFKKGVDFKFASINKLAIYASSFKKLDFDCSFINEARFSQVKGLNEANEIEELSDKHFSSKESFNFFEKVTKE